MEKSPRYGLAWATIGVAGCLVVVALIAGLFLPMPAKDLVHTKQLAAAIGSTDAAKVAEKQIVVDAAQNGVTVTGMKVVGESQGKDGSVTVKIRVQTIEIGQIVLDATLSKSVYTVQSIKRTG